MAAIHLTKRAKIVMVLISMLLALYYLHPAALTHLQCKAADTKFRLRGPLSSDSEITIIDLDQGSVYEKKVWPGNGDRLARIIQFLSRSDPRVIGMNFPPSTFEREGEAAHALAQAIQDSGRVVMGYHFSFSPTAEAARSRAQFERALRGLTRFRISITSNVGEEEVKPGVIEACGAEGVAPGITEEAAGAGYDNACQEECGVVRRIPLIAQAVGSLYPSFAAAVLQQYYAAQNVRVVFVGSDVLRMEVGSLKIPADKRGRLSLNYCGPEQSFPSYQEQELIAGKIPEKAIRRKIVLLGRGRSGAREGYLTPFSTAASDVEIQATCIDNIMCARYLIDVSESPAIAVVSIIAFPLLIGLLLSRSGKGLRDLLVTVLCAVAFLALDCYLFAGHRIQVNTVYPLLAIFSSSLALSVHTRRVREQRASRLRNSVVEMSAAIRGARDRGELFRVVLDVLMSAAGADRGMLFSCGKGIKNGEELHVECERNMPTEVFSGDGFAYGREIISGARSTSQDVVIRAMRRGKLFARPRSGSEALPRSVLCLPLNQRQAPVNMIYMESDALENVFIDEDADIITALAAQAAAVLEHALMYSTGRRVKDGLGQEGAYATRESEQTQRLSYIVGNSAAIQECLALVGKAAKSDITVLIEGETGTGKELIAKAIHFTGPREAAMFVAQNCSALPESLLESELFGHKRGAFTGAVKDKKGLFEIADRGTIFLDEVADMTPALQAKLLRVLQEGMIRPVGDVKEKRVDLRIISATNRNLAEEVKAGRFREDLYYRLNAFTIHVPPLRARREDIPVLAVHFVGRICKWLKKEIKGISAEAMAQLVTYDFPGNVRELENEMEKAIVMAGDGAMITADVLSEKIEGAASSMPGGDQHRMMKEAIISLERKMIARALRRHQGNKSRAARELGISRRGLVKMIERIKDIGLRIPRA